MTIPAKVLRRPSVIVLLVLLTSIVGLGVAYPANAGRYVYDSEAITRVDVHDSDSTSAAAVARNGQREASTVRPSESSGAPTTPFALVVATNTVDDVIGAACSFSGETRVLMADGTTKPISEVEVGDEVLAYDPETG